MLCMNNYEQDYIDECRQRVNVQLASYRNLIAAIDQTATNVKPLQEAINSFEPVFFNNLVLLLDQLFVHRSRAIEGKDGNPMNEVRVICNSLLNNKGKLIADKGIKLNPAKSILGYKVDDEIKLTEADFKHLSNGFFSAVENVFLLMPVAE